MAKVWYIQYVHIQGPPCSLSARKIKIARFDNNILKKLVMIVKLEIIRHKKAFIYIYIHLNHMHIICRLLNPVFLPRHASNLSLFQQPGQTEWKKKKERKLAA